MEALLRNMVLIMFVWLMLAGVCLGKQVYMTDGGIIDCESIWRRGGQVIVKVNRDIVVDFERSEIDLKRTFPEAKKNPHRVLRKKTARAVVPPSATALAAAAPTIPVTAAPPAPAANPVRPQAAAPALAAKPVPSPAPAPAPEAKEPVQPESAQSASADPSLPPDKAEMERRSRQAAEMMAEAIQKKDPELLKKAIEAQKSAMPQNRAETAGRSLRYLLLLLAVSLLIVVSMWVVFEKAGQSGVLSIIPIYNMYVLMEISGKPGWWLVLLFIPVVGFVFLLLAMLALAEKFGRGALFGLGLFFLPMFFFPMLAFGGSQYEG
ncbi:DUF5684 domain-containing protein [Geotalea uraniireducens]|uniref:Uncharacterized protein n=1 Tax=Geotalea uraniireducens (strain Rf4) TaxID=351605 RepID=A5GDE1_GEOUR|nr:DUF5684 domain-containing protein [Geotalea uraniireducens]ABQ24402.1 hypothetical protein Gura_0186 [Geotalea uraniireducens Rf4]